MNQKNNLYLTSHAVPPTYTDAKKNRSLLDPFNERPRKPDWLVLLMSALFLLTLLIAWLIY